MKTNKRNSIEKKAVKSIVSITSAFVFLAFLPLNSQAFFNNNSANNSWNAPWNNGFVKNNGFFEFNPYDYTDPRWYGEETNDMFDEFSDEFGNNNFGNNPYMNNPYMNGRNINISNIPTPKIPNNTNLQQKFNTPIR